MRELKFRVWDKDKKEWIIWSARTVFDLFDISQGRGRILYDLSKKKNVEIVQFTGLKDKNNDEIYEGDVLKRIDTHYFRLFSDDPDKRYKYDKPRIVVDQIIFEKGVFQLKDNKIARIFVWEIIGNIHEHPELLKEDL